jgi:hypothetical protein
LRTLAVDETEDLSTRLGAVRSYLSLAGKRAEKELPRLLSSKTWQVRAVAYVQALTSAQTSHKSLAEKTFRKEKPGRVKDFVARRVPALAVSGATSED